MSRRRPHPLADAAWKRGVRDRRVLDAIRAVDRGGFVPVEHRHAANRDAPIPIDRGQVTTQPSLVAQMVAALALDGSERVLEVGAGTGYQAAILAQLAAEVVTVERYRDLAQVARRNLMAAGIGNVEVVVGDGSQGWPQRAPYDAVVVAAAFPDVPDPLVGQIRDGGRLVQPLGPGGAEEVTCLLCAGGRLQPVATITRAHFVPLIGEHGFGAERERS